MTFARPDLLIWLWLLPIAAFFLLLAQRKRLGRLNQFFSLGPSFTKIKRGHSILKGVFMLLSLGLLMFSLARPRWGFEWTDVKRRGIDIVVAIDVSQSMLATDVDPSRLQRAKRKLADLLSMLEGDLVGLVAFAGDAFIQCPLTEDYSAINLFANYLNPSLIPVQGTDLGKAIRVATRALKDGGRMAEGASQDQENSQAIILITDGEDNEGKGLEAAKEATDSGIKIYTLAIGSEAGAPIPLEEGGFKKDSQGNLVITHPDEQSLEKIAVSSGGIFVRSVTSDADLQEIYKQNIRSSLTEKDIRETRSKLWHERFQWFIGAAMLLLMIEGLLSDVKSPIAMCFFLAFFFGNTSAFAESSTNPYQAYQKGDFQTAVKGFLEQEIDSPSKPETIYNRAAAQYKAKDFSNSAQGFAKVAEMTESSKELVQKSRFNEGNAWVGANRLDDAIKAYEEAIKLDPNDARAKDNLEYVKKLKEQQKEKQQQQNQDQNQNQDKEQQQNQDQNQNQDKEQQQNQDQNQNQDSAAKNQDQANQENNTQKNNESHSSDQNQANEQNDSKQNPENQKKNSEDTADQKNKSDHDQNAEQNEKKAESSQGGQPPPSQDPSENQNASASANHNPQPPSADNGKQPMNHEQAQELSKEAAEQVLRSAQDQIGRFLFAPNKAESRPNPGKDW